MDEAVCLGDLAEAGTVGRLLHLPHHHLSSSGTTATLLAPLLPLLPQLLQASLTLLLSLVWGGRGKEEEEGLKGVGV